MNDFLFRPLVEAALREDLRSGDITTDALIETGLKGRARMNFRADGVVCGTRVAKLAFVELCPLGHVEILVSDGQRAQTGETILIFEGSAHALLSAERVALNFVQRLSGIATLTARFVEATAGTRAQITDTRKTTPLLRALEKYAVRCGGARNHRFALDDMILIKDNHIALCGGITSAVEKARQFVGHSVKIEVECDTLEQVVEGVEAGADILLLDNMAPPMLAQAVQIVARRALCEASGGVNLETVAAIAQTGVDLISVGALTHGAPSLDIGLDIDL